jgi:hypothetical protein
MVSVDATRACSRDGGAGNPQRETATTRRIDAAVSTAAVPKRDAGAVDPEVALRARCGGRPAMQGSRHAAIRRMQAGRSGPSVAGTVEASTAARVQSIRSAARSR